MITTPAYPHTSAMSQLLHDLEQRSLRTATSATRYEIRIVAVSSREGITAPLKCEARRART